MLNLHMEGLHRNCSSLLLSEEVRPIIDLRRAIQSVGREACALPFRSLFLTDNGVFCQPLLYFFILHDNHIEGASPSSPEENSEFRYTLGRR